MNPSMLFIYNKITSLLPETRFFTLKNFLLKISGAKIGRNVRICSSVMFTGNGKLTIGNDCWIGSQALISVSSPAKINIGNNVDIAPRVFIGTGTHEIDVTGLHIAGKGISIDITIDDGSWICTSVILLPGVTINKKSIIGAGSIVTKDIPEYTLGAGNPCKVIKQYKQ